MVFRRALILITISLFAAAPFAAAKPPAGKGQAKAAEKAAEIADDAQAVTDDVRGKAGKRGKRDADANAVKEKAMAEDVAGDKAKAKDKAAADSQAGGRADEMRERRDERKAIMEETKGSAADGEAPKGKKAWWKFWGDEEGAAAE
jgi:hypothetical protein